MRGNKLVRLVSGHRPHEPDVVIKYSNKDGGEVDITFTSDVTQTAPGFHVTYEIESQLVSTLFGWNFTNNFIDFLTTRSRSQDAENL